MALPVGKHRWESDDMADIHATNRPRPERGPFRNTRDAVLAGIALCGAFAANGSAQHLGDGIQTRPVMRTPPGRVDADEALRKLQRGNASFVADRSEHPNAVASRRVATARDGEAPFAAVLASADPRVPVEYLFDRGLGDLYVVRVLGNVADDETIGSLEHGVDGLDVPLLVVLGNTRCELVASACVGDAWTQGGNLPFVLEDARSGADRALRVLERETRGRGDRRDAISSAIHENVWTSIEQLLLRSPSIRERVAHGTLRVVGSVYDVHTGAVGWLGRHPLERQLIAEGDGHGSAGAHGDHAPTSHGHDHGHGHDAHGVRTSTPPHDDHGSMGHNGSAHDDHAPTNHRAPPHGSEHGPAPSAHSDQTSTGHGDDAHGTSHEPGRGTAATPHADHASTDHGGGTPNSHAETPHGAAHDVAHGGSEHGASGHGEVGHGEVPQHAAGTAHNDHATASDEPRHAPSHTAPRASVGRPRANGRIEDAMRRMRAGNERFATGSPTADGLGPVRRRETGFAGPNPFATVLASADSRLSIERIFDAGIGDLVVTRVAGPIVGEDVAATIEYGVDHLATPVLVVVGNRGDGLLREVLEDEPRPGNLAKIDAPIAAVARNVARSHAYAPLPEQLDAAARGTAWRAIEDLFQRSPLCTRLVLDGELLVVGALYDEATGRIEWLGQHPAQDTLLGHLGAAPAPMHGR
jgi:carbonic anhydrase